MFEEKRDLEIGLFSFLAEFTRAIMKDTKVSRKGLPEWREKLGGIFLLFFRVLYTHLKKFPG